MLNKIMRSGMATLLLLMMLAMSVSASTDALDYGSFEGTNVFDSTGNNHWYRYSDVLVKQAGNPKIGSQSLLLEPSGDTYQNIYYPHSGYSQPGDFEKLGFYVQSGTSGNHEFKVNITTTGGTKTFDYILQDQVWHYINIHDTQLYSGAVTQVKFEAVSSQSGGIYFDAVAVYTYTATCSGIC